ncbi:hypothetical protein SAMN06265348_11811 [Pedobacter westerhofensis]|uniref:Uncharacterized protein n=1 Tax=Pedobacter westerhofensis TaxID=425512 RepID=A0A521FTK1_9SPHI|nr:hypothetical protein SAMN06265348_11811 [Pedobacter westerhofensis]
MARAWYAFTNISADPLLASSYKRVTNTPSCINGTGICAIYVYYIGDSPAVGTAPLSPLTRNIQEYIVNGLVNLVAEPDLPDGSKKYLYLKSPII